MSALFDNLLTIFILLSLFIIIYCKIANKTLVDIFREIREAISPPTEEVIVR